MLDRGERQLQGPIELRHRALLTLDEVVPRLNEKRGANNIMNAAVIVRSHLHDLFRQLLLDWVGLAIRPFLEKFVSLLCIFLAGQIVHGGERTHGLLDEALDLPCGLDAQLPAVRRQGCRIREGVDPAGRWCELSLRHYRAGSASAPLPRCRWGS